MEKRKNSVAICIVVCCVAILIVTIVTDLLFFMYGISNTEIWLEGNGLAILSIAVTVWVGLNIYNNLKETDVERKLEELQKANNKAVYDYKLKIFLSELQESEERHEITKIFLEFFRRKSDIEIDLLDKLIKLEKLFKKCWKFYEDRKWDMCNETSESLKIKINEIYIEYKLYIGTTYKDIVYLYLKTRESDVLFYNYVCKGNKLKKDVTDFRRSIDIYRNIRKECYWFTQEAKNYVNNTIVYSDLQLLKFGKIDDNKKSELKREIEEISHEMKNKTAKGRYLQNIGAYYEKISNAEEDGLKKAMEYYKDALVAQDVDDKIFNLLGSLYLKIIDRECNVKDREYGLDTFDFSNQKDNIEKAIIYLKISRTAKPNLTDGYANLAKAYAYRWLAYGKTNERDIKNAELNIELALELDSGSSIVLYTYRNLYEIKGEYSKASEINEKLKEKCLAGDVERMGEIYGQKS